MANEFDVILGHIGTGKWNYFMFILPSLWWLILPVNKLTGAFMSPVPKGESCVSPYDSNQLSEELLLYVDHPKQCSVLAVSSSGENSTLTCQQWSYSNTSQEQTLVAEMNLVCDRRLYQALFISILFFGTVIGGITMGPLSDRFGRKRVWVYGTFLFTSLSALVAWMPNITSILIIRFFQGAVTPHAMVPGYTAAMESCEVKHRSTVLVLMALPWSLGTMLVGAVAYLIPHWRYMQLAGCVPLIVLIPLLWFYDESPRWLLVNGRHEEARIILEKAARRNGTSLPDEATLTGLMHAIQDSSGKSGNSSENCCVSLLSQLARIGRAYCTLFATPLLRRITILNSICCFFTSLVYYGFALSPAMFGTNPYVYMALIGLAEFPAHTFPIWILKKVGRRPVTCVCFIAAGIAILLLLLVPADYKWGKLVLILVGKTFFTTAFQIQYFYSGELFPTAVRSTGLGSGSFWDRLAALVPPFIEQRTSQGLWYLPPIMYGLLGITAGFLYLFFPETKGRPLPDTVQELENMALKSTKSSRNDAHALN